MLARDSASERTVSVRGGRLSGPNESGLGVARATQARTLQRAGLGRPRNRFVTAARLALARDVRALVQSARAAQRPPTSAGGFLVKSSYAGLAVVGLAFAGLWYAGGGPALAPKAAAAAEQSRVSAPLTHENL